MNKKMRVRDLSLPPGWYPRETEAIARFLQDYVPCDSKARAAIAPHAGWFYSGKTAARALSALDRSAQTVVVLGGHLPAGMPVLFAMEDAVRTPLGTIPFDTELRQALLEPLRGGEDCFRDNTVEVLLPMIRFFFPSAALLWMRLPAMPESFSAGVAIARAAEKLRRTIVVAASCDLTHYGDDYGFAPHGSGAGALHWVRETNDARFIRAVENGDPETVLLRAQKEKSACSVGAVLGALGFAKTADLKPARLLEYATSVDSLENDEDFPGSFVGYAGFAFHEFV
jgi:AmmeMemoRadiSam system protein B